jgi:hypothetical protein
MIIHLPVGSRDSSVGIATRYGLEGRGIESRWGEIFRTYPDRLGGPPSLLYNGYRVFPGGKGGRVVMLTTPPSSAEVKKELRYTSTHPMGPPGPVTGFPLPLPLSLPGETGESHGKSSSDIFGTPFEALIGYLFNTCTQNPTIPVLGEEVLHAYPLPPKKKSFHKTVH